MKKATSFTEQSQALKPTKKGKKKLKVFLPLACKDAYKAYKDAVDIFDVGKFLISKLYETI